MLLVLQSVHEATPTEEFFALQKLVEQVVDNYLPMITRSNATSERQNSGQCLVLDVVSIGERLVFPTDQSSGAGSEGRFVGTEDMPTSQTQHRISHRRGSSLGTVDKNQLPLVEEK